MKPTQPLKARGAASNPTPRYDALASEPVDDGWAEPEPDPAPGTVVSQQPAKSIITENDSPDVPFDQSINPYRGCEHGCIYCFARPSHAWLGLSPGLDFETQIIAKPNAPTLLEAELRRRDYVCKPLAVGTNTDPYQPVENRLAIMRGCLQVMAAFGQPVQITTKSALVTRDIDILAPMAARGLAAVMVSVTTLDRDLCRSLEPRAATPAKRLATIKALAEAGIPVTVSVAPVIPVITDHELERILEAAAKAGAIGASTILLRLPLEVKDLFAEWLELHAPGKAAHVLSLLRQSRDGKLNEARFGKRMEGSGPFAELLAQRFRLACRKLGLGGRMAPLDCGQFRPPPRPGDQLRLF